MRFPRATPGLLFLLLGLCGCSQTGGLRPATPENMKTTAAVGDRAMPVVAGAPGDSLRADTADPDLPRSSRGRLSGRVYDDDGKPAANAMVRLAVGGDPGGRAVFARTDRSGAFTLNGLRPGSSYTVIAEYQGEQGMMSGRADADAPDADVRISLHLRDARRSVAAAPPRPRRSSTRPISRIEADDENAAEDEPTIVNREDLPAPAAEADADVRRSRAETRRARPSESVMLDPDIELDREQPRRAWSSGTRSSGSPGDSNTTDEPMLNEDAEAEDFNPLPPAREIGLVGDRGERPPVRTADRARARRTAPASVEPPAAEDDVFAFEGEGRAESAGDAPRPLPDEFGRDGRAVPPRQFAPLLLDQPESASARSASPSRSRRAPQPVEEETDDQPESETPKAVRAKRPTWSELSLHSTSIPLDEAVARTSARGTEELARTVDLAAKVRPVETSASLPVPSPSNGRSLAPSLLPGRASGPFCDFDESEQRLNDFALPDVNGRMVSFRDLDADLVLLDFWGTWCGQCLTSIPHLKELQSTLGGKRLQVVGIACEQKPTAERAAAVSEAVKKLGINYTVLVTGMDGKCRVQPAFHVQFYPTMVLLDRSGRVLCRQEGATTETLTKIDNQIARELDRETASAARRSPIGRR